MNEKIGILQDKIAKAKLGVGTDRIEKEHQKGTLTARERIMLL